MLHEHEEDLLDLGTVTVCAEEGVVQLHIYKVVVIFCILSGSGKTGLAEWTSETL